MVDSRQLARAGCRYLGTPYDRMDCQAFWEKVLSDCGLKMDLGGSNSWYRELMQHGWVGTPEECVADFGNIPPGATLFIREDVSASTPAQYCDDGIGDITHMGVYTAMTGDQMAELATEEGVKDADRYNYGNGAIHSSSSRGCVCTSKFSGKTIPNGGWNRVGLYLSRISYGDVPVPDPPPETTTAVVVAESGSTVKMRAKPSTKCGLYWDVPIGDTVTVLAYGDDWTQICWHGITGYMMTQFLDFGDQDQVVTESWTVVIPGLTEARADALIAQYPEAYKTPEELVVG